MIRKTITALSAALLLTTSMAQARMSDQYDAATKAAATAAYSVEQNKWWDDFTSSGKKVVDYIEDVSTKNPQAAMWFLLTGGKMGFASRKATEEEATKMFSAMRNIATHFGNAANKADGLEAWKDVAQKHHAGQVHLDMIYKKIDELEETNKLLNIRMASLEEKLAKEKEERKAQVGSLEERIRALEADKKAQGVRITQLEQKLDQERADREKAVKEEAAARIRDIQAHAEQMLKMQEAFEARMLKLAASHEERILSITESTRDKAREEAKAESNENLRQMREMMAAFMSKQDDTIERLTAMVESTQDKAQAERARLEVEAKARVAEARSDARQSQGVLYSMLAEKSISITPCETCYPSPYAAEAAAAGRL